MEIWKPVVGWEGIYEVSSLGRFKRIIGGRGAIAGKILTPTTIAGGYKAVRFRFMGRASRPLVQSVVMQAFVGPRPPKMEINHLDGDRANNSVSNLEYCTSSENKLHAYKHLNRPKVSCKGSANGTAKLDEEKAREIRRRYSDGGISYRLLAREYGVSKPVISGIIKNTLWKHA